MNEGDLQRKIQKIIRENGAYVVKNNGNIFTEVGRPDLFACVPISVDRLKGLLLDEKNKSLFKYCDTIGIFLAIEVKMPDKYDEITDAQKINMNKIRDAGGIGLFIDDPEKIKVLIKHLREN